MGHFGREGTLKEKGHFERSCFHFERRDEHFEGVGTLGGHHGMEGHFERKGGHFEGMGQFVKALASLGSLFPTCQVRVVRFYVSLFSSSSSSSSFSSCRPPQLRSCEFSVACRTSTAIL